VRHSLGRPFAAGACASFGPLRVRRRRPHSADVGCTRRVRSIMVFLCAASWVVCAAPGAAGGGAGHRDGSRDETHSGGARRRPAHKANPRGERAPAFGGIPGDRWRRVVARRVFSSSTFAVRHARRPDARGNAVPRVFRYICGPRLATTRRRMRAGGRSQRHDATQRCEDSAAASGPSGRRRRD